MLTGIIDDAYVIKLALEFAGDDLKKICSLEKQQLIAALNM